MYYYRRKNADGYYSTLIMLREFSSFLRAETFGEPTIDQRRIINIALHGVPIVYNRTGVFFFFLFIFLNLVFFSYAAPSLRHVVIHPKHRPVGKGFPYDYSFAGTIPRRTSVLKVDCSDFGVRKDRGVSSSPSPGHVLFFVNKKKQIKTTRNIRVCGG